MNFVNGRNGAGVAGTISRPAHPARLTRARLSRRRPRRLERGRPAGRRAHRPGRARAYTVLIADDAPATRQGLVELLEDTLLTRYAWPPSATPTPP